MWDAITRHADGYLWKIEYEPWVGGAERGLTAGGGTVTAWEPLRHFATRTRPETERDGFNEIDYVLEPLGAATYLRYTHRAEIPADDFDRQLDACRAHTSFYNHSLGQYACHFAGREPVYVSVDGPAASADGGFAALRRALGIPDDVVAGDRVRLTPAGLDADRGRRGLRHGPVPRRPQRRRALPRLRARRLGLARGRRPPPVRRRRRPGGEPSGPGATGWRACSRPRRWRDGAVRGADLRAGAPGGAARGADAGPHGAARTGSPSRAAGSSPGSRWSRPETATAIRGGAITDGPFIETKEVLGGVFVIEARDLDHALALAAMTPIVDGGVEVRPLLGFQVLEAG